MNELHFILVELPIAALQGAAICGVIILVVDILASELPEP